MTDDSVVAEVVDRTRRLAAIPAPPLHESARAAVVADWWRASFERVVVDDVGNVWAVVRSGAGPALVVAAHLDTVFDVDVDHGTREHDGILFGPSVGDDSVAVAALGALDALLPAELTGPVWVLATVGEEGLGNLVGIRHALTVSPVPIGAVIALEGNWLGRVCITGVGSVRRRLTLTGPGGHAWEAADVDSAVHGIARVVAALDSVPLPEGVRTSLNVGLIGGGTAINARADRAWCEIDLRAEDPTALERLEDLLGACVRAEAGDLVVDWEGLGERPAGGIDPSHPLVLSAVESLNAAGIRAELTAASTDANAAHAAGIPAIALGITRGAKEHTVEEWIELRPIPTGLSVLAETITRYLRRS